MREEEKKRKSQKSGMKRLLSKRWALPAIYLVSAALLLTAILWFQDDNKELGNLDKTTDPKIEDASKVKDQEAVEVNAKQEDIAWPLAEKDQSVIKKEFYDLAGPKESQENALIHYDNKYELSRGIDVAKEDGSTFDVLAAISGKVTKVQEDALLGNVIEVEHGNGIITKYQSVTDIAVKVGDKVDKGQSLAKAGQSLLNKEAGIHVHFEIRKDNVAVNPVDYFDKSVRALAEAKLVNADTKTDDETEAAKESAKESKDEDASGKDSTEEGTQE